MPDSTATTSNGTKPESGTGPSPRTARQQGSTLSQHGASAQSGEPDRRSEWSRLSNAQGLRHDKHTSGHSRYENSSTGGSSIAPPMQKTVNTIPVFARSHHQAPPSSSYGRSDFSARAIAKPAASLVSSSKHAQTALATKAAAGDKTGAAGAEDGDAHSIASSSSSQSSGNGEGLSRFSSFTVRGGRHAAHPVVGTDSHRPLNKDSPAAPAASGRMSNVLTSIVAAMQGEQSKSSMPSLLDANGDTTDSGGRDDEINTVRTPGSGKAEGRSVSYDEEKRLVGAEEGARGGWSYEDSHDVEKAHRAGGLDDIDADADAGDNGDSQEHEGAESRHYPLTPGWDTPWRPESRGEHSIMFGKYRFNNFGEGGYFPRTASERRKDAAKAKSKKSSSRQNSTGMFAGVNLMDLDWWRKFLIHNAFVPLLFRVINITFTSATLAIAIKLFRTLREEGASDAVGSSPIVAIIFAPLTLVHVFTQIYIEYFSHPIGLWRVGTKLFYTLIELVFVCLWSAELSLSFDNYFTSTLVCSSYDSPYATGQGKDDPSVFGEQMLNNPARKPEICRLQSALIGLVFTSLLAYIIVLAVSLFRIFVRVSKR